MKIVLKFMVNREVMTFIVENKEIFYTDRIFSKRLRCIPKDKDFNKIIVKSRNKYPAQLQKMFNLSKEEQKEYDDTAPKGDEALAEVVIRDCRSKGLQLLQKEIIPDGSK